MKILSIQVGMPKEISYKGDTFQTGIFKNPVSGKVQVHETKLEGDGQADLNVHGGHDKAIYAYSHDTYEWWKETRNLSHLPNGAMGENLTVENLDEKLVFVGDVFEIGDCLLQVSEPRYPCFKLAAMYNDAAILKQFMKLNRPGVYFRVLKTGTIESGMELKLVSQEETKVTLLEMFEFKNKAFDRMMAKKLLEIKSLNGKWRLKIESALA
ncbi:MAG: MOSC domain-containing protein [Bacteriovoracaceae bacterium]